MEVCVATAPVGNLGEGVSDENILVGIQDRHSTRKNLNFHEGLWGPLMSLFTSHQSRPRMSTEMRLPGIY